MYKVFYPTMKIVEVYQLVHDWYNERADRIESKWIMVHYYPYEP